MPASVEFYLQLDTSMEIEKLKESDSIPDYQKLRNDFIEIIATRLHAWDQLSNGVMPPDSVTKGWLERYRGTPLEELPPYTVELNRFKAEVDNCVAMLIQAVRIEGARR